MIDFQQVSKRYGGQIVLANVGFRINPGERVGIVGPNGAGKSTVFSMIAGELSPDAGEIAIPRHCRLGYLRQHLRPHAEDTTLLDYAEGGLPELVTMHHEIESLEHRLTEAPPDRDDLLDRLGRLQTRYENMGGYAMRHRSEAALSGLGFRERDFDKPFASFSGGWQMRAELARVTVAEPEVLMMDEPSNYLDTVAIEWLQRFLRGYSGTLLLISHDRYLLESLCTVTLEIANGQATRYPGNYEAYVQARAQREQHVQGAQVRQDRERKQAERFIERFRAKNTKASLVQSKIKTLERMEKIEVLRPVTSPGRIRIPPPAPCGQHVVQLEGIGMTYDQREWVLRGVDLDIERGEKMAFVGLNGTGKTTLLRLLAGQLACAEGVCRLGHKVTTGYQSQEFTDILDPRHTVFEVVKQAGARTTDLEVRTLLGGFGFSGNAVEKRVAVLSGGEKVRLAFARLLVHPPSLLILDEPTTHLDIPAREALEEGLCNYEGTLCFVSHDIRFVRRVAESVVAMTPPGIRRYAGGYDYYRRRLATEQADAPEGAGRRIVVKPAATSVRKEARRDRAEVVQKYSQQRRELQKQVARLEKRIAECEGEQATLVAQYQATDVIPDYAALNRQLADVQQKLVDTVRRWEAHAIELDELERDYAQQRARTGRG